MAKNFIKGAIKRPGAFTAKAKAAGKSVSQYASEKAHAPGRLGQEARFAQTLKRISRNRG